MPDKDDIQELWARLSLGFMDALFATVHAGLRIPLGLALFDSQLRYVRINPTLARMNGLSVEDHIGKGVGQILPGIAETMEQALRRVLDTGEPVTDLEIIGEAPAAPGRPQYRRASYYPVIEGGRVIGAGAIVVEVTERVRMRQQLENQAQHIYDDVVQALTVAKMALEFGEAEQIVMEKIERSLGAAKHLSSHLLIERELRPPADEDTQSPWNN